MKQVTVRELNAKDFQPFGSFAKVVNPSAEKLGAPPVEFYRDLIQGDIEQSTPVSFSNCRVEARPLVIEWGEYHNRTCEGIMPLDNDILIHVGPATPEGAPIPLDSFQVYRVPCGTMVILRPGIWHHAPFTANKKPANVLIVLPERTYANDCVAKPLGDEEKIQIVGA